MKTELSDGREIEFSFMEATGFVSGSTVEITARDVNIMLNMFNNNPVGFGRSLTQLCARFPENRLSPGGAAIAYPITETFRLGENLTGEDVDKNLNSEDWVNHDTTTD